MLRDYSPLPAAMLQAGVGYAQPTQAIPERATLDDSATSVMTDLTRVTAVIILPGDTVDEAHRRMVQRGVRMLLVVDQDRKVVGLPSHALLGSGIAGGGSFHCITREEPA